MSNEIILNADLRIRTGTNKTREIRREDSMVPAIIYGNEQESKNIKVEKTNIPDGRVSGGIRVSPSLLVKINK